jgi:hypothetical protein
MVKMMETPSLLLGALSLTDPLSASWRLLA